MVKLMNVEKAGFFLLAAFVITGLVLGFTDVDYFENNFAVEDGLVEWTTTLLLFGSSLFLLRAAISLRRFKTKLWVICTLGLAGLFFFGAGEEISWGQRIFGIESSEFFEQNNAQKETNLHNLVVGETKLNKLIFGQILTAILIIYLIIIPAFYKKWDWLAKLVKLFAVPLPHWHHTLAFVLLTGLIMAIPSSKRWEVYELGFALIFFLIFLNPRNNTYQVLPEDSSV